MTGTTPFPNHLIDRELPRLRDTEWRLLCVVVRQTVGWRRASGERKESDWLTQSQLMRRTGRSSEALAAAIDGLVKRGLIRVRSVAGDDLPTASLRRRHRGHLYYSLAEKANTEKRIRQKKNDTKMRTDPRPRKSGWQRVGSIR